jgi:hypothetical protein
VACTTDAGAAILEGVYARVKLRTIKMRRATAIRLRSSSKFDRSPAFVKQLRTEGHGVAREFLQAWDPKPKASAIYPYDAGYW